MLNRQPHDDLSRLNVNYCDQMNYMKNRITQSLTLFVLMLFIFSGYGVSLARDVGTSKVIFYVK
jgi:hypothetical protein